MNNKEKQIHEKTVKFINDTPKYLLIFFFIFVYIKFGDLIGVF